MPSYVASDVSISSSLVQGVGKGVVVRNLISTMGNRGDFPDFILCVGDDRSDEDMFGATTTAVSNSVLPETAEIFTCTIGNKPSLAKYYLDDPVDVVKMLQGLTKSPVQHPEASGSQVLFED